MNKIIIALCAFLAVACAEHNQELDGYLNYSRQKFQQNVADYDQQLSEFEQKFHKQVETVELQRELVVDSITRTQERFTPMEWITGPVKQCVLKYRGRVESVTKAVESLAKCKKTAYVDLRESLIAAFTVRNYLNEYLKTEFENEIVKCGNNTARIYEVVAKAGKFIQDNRNSFNYELEAARCGANVHVKKTVHCSYLVQSGIQYRIGEVNALFTLCLVGKDECKPCGNTCENTVVVDGNSQGKTIANPFYGGNKKPNCLLVNFEYKNKNMIH